MVLVSPLPQTPRHAALLQAQRIPTSDGLLMARVCVSRDIEAGTFIAAFKGNASAPNCLARLGRDYIVAAQTTRSALHFWTWHKVVWQLSSRPCHSCRVQLLPPG